MDLQPVTQDPSGFCPHPAPSAEPQPVGSSTQQDPKGLPRPLESAVQPVTRTRADAQALYDRLSPFYDFLAGRGERRLVEAALLWLAVCQGERVLEIGPGAGRALLSMARLVGMSGRVYGLDLSPGMLRVAQHRIARAGLSARVELRRGDAACLPFASASLDAVLSSFTLELFDIPDIPVVLAESRRVLRPGGRLAIVAMSKMGSPGPMLRLYEWAHRRFPRALDCRPIYAQAAVEEAGFRLVEASVRSLWGLSVEILLAAK